MVNWNGALNLNRHWYKEDEDWVNVVEKINVEKKSIQHHQSNSKVKGWGWGHGELSHATQWPNAECLSLEG